MFEKSGMTKDSMIKIITVLIIASVVMLALSILTDDQDGRKMISDDNGSTEEALCSILSEIKGVGEVNVMLQYDEKEKVKGVIVTAQGAEDPVVRNNVVKGVSTVFDISGSNVMVFEKNQKEKAK